MPETPYPENEHDKLPQSGHSAAWHCGYHDYWAGCSEYRNLYAYADRVNYNEWRQGWNAAQAEDEAVDGSDKDIGA